ncbi:MAG: DUF1587 domain-containing protein [Deltaproteobacteria bacterium]|nr:DUF1587 domain-containing protein [Deltaproteobacteria bacterium]
MTPSPRLLTSPRFLHRAKKTFLPVATFCLSTTSLLTACILFQGCFNPPAPANAPSIPLPQTTFVDGGAGEFSWLTTEIFSANQVDLDQVFHLTLEENDGGTPQNEACPVVQMPPLSQARLLTTAQYQRSMKVLFDLDESFIGDFPAENQVEGFSGNHRVHQASSQLVDKWMVRAEEIAHLLLADRRALLLQDCFLDAEQQPLGESQCAEKVIAHWQLRIFRRPASIEEQKVFFELFELA